MMIDNRPLVVASVITALLGLVPAGSSAQAGKDEQAGLEEVVVTAERREASLQEVPLAVTALSEAALENRAVTEARDLMRYTPSLKMFNNITSPTNLSPSMRGSLTQDASLVVAEAPFGIYVDDIYLARLNGNNVTLADIERVEVLRGPQGTLYGRNTLVGAVKFVTRAPGEDFWLDAQVGAGNFEQYKASVSVGGPIADSGWGGSFAAQYTNKDGQFFNRHPTVNRDTGLERNVAARAKLRYFGAEGYDLTFTLSYSDSKNDAAQLIPATTPNVPSNRQFTSDDLVPQFGTYVLNTPNVARVPDPIKNLPEGRTKQTIGSVHMSYDFGWGQIKSITGYVGTKDFFSTDFSGNGNVNGANKADVNQLSEEIQFLGKVYEDRISFLLGLYLFKEDGDQRFGWNSYLPFPPNPVLTPLPISTSDIAVETESYAFFGQVDYQISDVIKASFGARYTSDDKKFDFTFRSLLANTTTVLPTFRDTFSRFTPKLAIDWKVPARGPFDSLLMYVSAADAFKSGGYSAIAIFSPIDVLRYKPETNRTYEFGFKTDMLGNRLRINANYFYSEVEDVVINQTLPGGRFPVNNAGDQTIKGLEFEVTAAPIDGLTLFASGALLSGAYKNLNPFAAPALAPTLFGVQAVPPQIPDYSIAIGFDYKRELANGGTLAFGADWYETDDYITAATNDFRVTGFGLGNAFVEYGWNENWSVRAAVKNFTDENTITTGSRGFLGGFIPLRPREYMFTVRYRFGD
ncbi:MAG: TonB-dependent receptor [Steroidobacteraceae bacterium]|nr:TonB-dependent receptor [Steroidobacteraceae bacterium]MDW8260649.1 TonB-dependent receptor [Gammaproteobacteria bacterium]